MGAVGGELDDLRSDLAEELVFIRLLLEAGHLEAASRLIDEQSGRLRHFQDHMEAAIASAVVERTAEEILAAAAETPESADIGAQAPGDEAIRETVSFDSRAAASEGVTRPRLRPLVAAVCLGALVAVFVTGGPLPGLYELVSGRSSDSSHSATNGDRPAGKDPAVEDTDATPGDASAMKAAEEVAPTPPESLHDDSADAPEILLLLGRLARFAEGTRSTPVAALLDVDRLVARLVTEVAPLLAPLPSEPPQGKAAPAPQPAQPNVAPQAQPNSGPQPPATGELPADQPQRGAQPPTEAPGLTPPPAPTDGGSRHGEGDRMDDSWLKRRPGEGEPAPQPTNSSEVPSRLGQHP